MARFKPTTFEKYWVDWGEIRNTVFQTWQEMTCSKAIFKLFRS